MTRSAPISVLSLEDDDLDAELVQERLKADALAATFCRVKTRSEYEAALDSTPFEIILSDFSVPGYDGLAALEAAKLRLPGVPFIFVSGAIGEERALETLRRGATDYVLKERLERLGPAVRRALGEADEKRKRREAEEERDRLLVSERHAREVAEAANRMKDEFLAVVSHELRTPLNAILGWASLLCANSADPATVKKALTTIERNARVQSRLIEDILDISRVITGKLQLRVTAISVATVVNAAVEAVRPAAAAKSIALSVDTADAGQISADADRLQQVVWNLLSNAVKFTPKGGSVSLTARRAEGTVEIVVADSGLGMDASLLPHVFERFRQGDATPTRRHGGLGLGLAIVRHLVELHGGTVAAESDGVGRGSRFIVRLPLSAEDLARQRALDRIAAEPVPTPSDEPPASLRGIAVLVVDDEADTRELVAFILRSSGARVTAAASVAEALARLRSERPAVIVSDIGMPEVDGYSFVRRLRALPPEAGGHVPAIALTAYARELDRREAEAAGYQRHLSKPVAPTLLVATVAEVARAGSGDDG